LSKTSTLTCLENTKRPGQITSPSTEENDASASLFGWLVADGWRWFVLREEYCWLVAGD
jgi:hypothetical protein